MIAWVLSLMILLQPIAPWRDSYEGTATAIAAASVQSPLFTGANGPARTAAFLVALGWFESRFDVHALGDHGRSHGLYQQQGRGELADPVEATTVALETIRQSFKACHGRPLEESLGWYAAGGNDCTRGLKESRHRVRLATWLFRDHPPHDGSI